MISHPLEVKPGIRLQGSQIVFQTEVNSDLTVDVQFFKIQSRQMCQACSSDLVTPGAVIATIVESDLFQTGQPFQMD